MNEKAFGMSEQRAGKAGVARPSIPQPWRRIIIEIRQHDRKSNQIIHAA
jgi:hypothetical protein